MDAPLPLTDEQTQAADTVSALLATERFVRLSGSAGTGKTTVAGHLIRQWATEQEVYVCAPTHKAALVLAQAGLGSAQTLHAFLGLSLTRDGQGSYALRQLPGFEVPRSGRVVVDEASMLGDVLWSHIEATSGLSWLLVGDPAQLPPVKEAPSPALSLPGAQLDTVVRQAADNPIINLATHVRMGADYLTALAFERGIGAARTTRTDAFLQSAARAFRAAPPATPPPVRILAYRNARVRYYNDAVRQWLHGSAQVPRFAEGDWLMMRESFFEGGLPVLRNSVEIQVVSSRDDQQAAAGFVWRIQQVAVASPEGTPVTLPVLDSSETARYRSVLARLRAKAVRGEGAWNTYYELREAFAQVDYAYALTVHKAQGSTFDTAFVDHRDLMRCRPAERQALVYVAVTRPARRLALLI